VGVAPARLKRAQQFGPNKFDSGKAESRWRVLARQYADPMQVVLLVAGVGSLYPPKELGTGILLLLLTVFNAVLGLRQEGKAAAAVAALQQMMIVLGQGQAGHAPVRRSSDAECMPSDADAVQRASNGENDRVHLLVEQPPKVAISTPVNSLKGVPARAESPTEG